MEGITKQDQDWAWYFLPLVLLATVSKSGVSHFLLMLQKERKPSQLWGCWRWMLGQKVRKGSVPWAAALAGWAVLLSATARAKRTRECTRWLGKDTNLLTVNKADIWGMCHNIPRSKTTIMEYVFTLDIVFLANKCREKQRMILYKREGGETHYFEPCSHPLEKGQVVRLTSTH